MPTPRQYVDTRLVIDLYDVPGTYTWNKAVGAKTHDLVIMGSSGGGMSGGRGAVGTARIGGTSGGGGAMTMLSVSTSLLGATETVVVGARGLGGAGVTVDNTPGVSGTTGGDSTFSSLRAGGGPGGGTGNPFATGQFPGLPVVTGSSTVGTSAGNSSSAGCSGGAGGGITGAEVVGAGGAGGKSNTNTFAVSAGGVANGGNGVNGQNSVGYTGGSSGGGGGANIGGPGGAGGAGGKFMCGGGGGGASTNGFPSGPGSNGVDGLVLVITRL